MEKLRHGKVNNFQVELMIGLYFNTHNCVRVLTFLVEYNVNERKQPTECATATVCVAPSHVHHINTQNYTSPLILNISTTVANRREDLELTRRSIEHIVGFPNINV